MLIHLAPLDCWLHIIIPWSISSPPVSTPKVCAWNQPHVVHQHSQICQRSQRAFDKSLNLFTYTEKHIAVLCFLKIDTCGAPRTLPVARLQEVIDLHYSCVVSIRQISTLPAPPRRDTYDINELLQANAKHRSRRICSFITDRDERKSQWGYDWKDSWCYCISQKAQANQSCRFTSSFAHSFPWGMSPHLLTQGDQIFLPILL